MWTNYLPAGVPFVLKALSIMVSSLGVESTVWRTPLFSFGKSPIILTLLVSCAVTCSRGEILAGRRTVGRPQVTPILILVSGGQPQEWKVSSVLVSCPAAWPVWNSWPRKQSDILGILGCLLTRVFVTLTVATRPLWLLACSMLTGTRSLAKMIGPVRPLSTKSTVDVAHDTALALRSMMNLLQCVQPLWTSLVSVV